MRVIWGLVFAIVPLWPFKPNLTFIPDWENYRFVLKAKLELQSFVDRESYSVAREILLEGLREGLSYYLEELYFDQNLQIKDVLMQNPGFAQEYSFYISQINLQFFSQDGNSFHGVLEIPVRQSRGFYSILPMPWNKRNYEGLLPEEYVGQAYVVKKIQKEYINSVGEPYTCLIIDVRNLPFMPSFAPRVFSKNGRLIYGPEFLNAATGKERGVVGFYYSLEHPELARRVGKKALYVLPLTVSGKNQTNVVLAEEDVEDIFGHPVTLKNLRKARVAFILDRK